MKLIKVQASRPYDILIEKGSIFDVSRFIPDVFAPPRKICVITDSTVGLQYAEGVISNLKEAGYDTFKISFPAGEHSKTITTYSSIIEALGDEGFTRGDLVLGLGGGTVGDIAGFVAGTYMRGVNYIYVPTTLLAIIDSSLGGKTGINMLGGKNLAGVFWTPSIVVVDPQVLETLSEDSLRDGLAEALKTAIISDSGLVGAIKDRNYTHVIDRCISIKRPLVEVDEYDTGLRQLLSFGQTIGNCLEKLSSFSISHGEAIAKGLVAESRAAYQSGYSKTDVTGEITRLLSDFDFDTDINYDPEDIYRLALMDKKIRDGFVNIVVPEVIGKCAIRKIRLSDYEDYIMSAF